MTFGQLLNGKATYSAGWAGVASGLVLASSVVGEQLQEPSVVGPAIIAAVLSSKAPELIIGGLAIIGFRRAMAKMQAAKEMPPGSAEAELEAFKGQLKDILTQLESRNAKDTSV